jgi:thiol-disulfide isomerase/thioredoxin
VEPLFKQLAKDNKKIKFIRIDIDEANETMPNELNEINSVPTFKFYYDNKQIDTFSGANLTRIRDNVDNLKKLVKKTEKGAKEKDSSEKSSGEGEEDKKKKSDDEEEEEDSKSCFFWLKRCIS